MNHKLIAYGLGLFGYGALVGWAITADKADEKIARLEKDLDSVSLKFQERSASVRTLVSENAKLKVALEDAKASSDDLNESVDEEEAASETENSPGENFEEINSGGEIEEVGEEEVPEPTDEEIEATRAGLQEMLNQYISPEASGEFVPEAARIIEEARFTPPFVISEAKFNWDEEEGDDYSKWTFRYFPRDRVLLDEDDEPVPATEIEKMVGWRNLNRFGDESNHADIVYIRNRRMQADIEVTREEDEELPIHVKYGMPKIEFDSHKAAGLIKFREEDV